MTVTAPTVHRRAGFPARVTIWEVGPRDGLQNEPTSVPTEAKAELVRRLVAAGLTTVEATSFVAPGRVPQLADAEELFARLERPAGVRLPALVPNEAGLARALACGVRDICVFASATESFARRNLNRSVDGALEMFAPVIAEGRAGGLGVRAYVSMCFGDPWEGAVDPDRVVAVTERLLDLGCDEVSLGDTIGVATTGQVHDLLARLGAAGIGPERLAVHFHDTYGQALANALAAVEAGVTTVDAAAGGLGGCPFARSATGNLATEDLCWALAGLGVETGVDLSRLVATSVWLAGELGRPSPSRVVQALARAAEPLPGGPGAGLGGGGRPVTDDLSPAGLELRPEHEALVTTVRRFARDDVAPVIGGYYERGQFPYPLVAAMGEMGLFGLPFPEELGGMGGDTFALCLVLEELARVDSSLAITLEAGVGLGAMPIYRFGTEDQRQRWPPELCAGRSLAAFGLTEPGGGSDAGATRTTAARDGEEWVVDGAKAFITNSGTKITSLVTVTAVTGRRADGRPEISALVVPAGTPGFTVGPGYSKVGWAASDTHELAFAGCRVPADHLLGEEGRGYAQFLSILDTGRVAIGALSVGLAQGCIDECLRYLGERRAFGRALAESQVLQFKVADMEARTHVARLAVRDAAARLVAGRPFRREAAIAKLVASEAAMANAREATQIFGGYGFMNETPVGRFYRDAKILEIGEGTSEIQRMLIARELGLPAGP